MNQIGVLIDMDGVIYRASEPIPGAVRFINFLEQQCVPFLFVTNNSARSAHEYSHKLHDMEIKAPPASILTAGQVAVDFLTKHYDGGRILCIGEPSMEQGLLNAGFQLVTDERPDCVLMAEMRSLSYDLLCVAARHVSEGARFVATNPDLIIPCEHGFILGCGAMTRVLECSTGRSARFLGKPHPEILECATGILGLHHDELVMIGDSLNTDIELAVRNGLRSVLVMSGATDRQGLESSCIRPTRVVGSVEDLADISPFDWFSS
ncbi:MAG: HAD-IIA family hydrolase [Clostridia bacterium]|nr:HAD-IIA family hydrolase [Clostridia bacterium]